MGANNAIPDTCLFGQALTKARIQAGISQSRLGMLAECNLSNLRLIEKGQIQAGVSSALRLLKPLKIDTAIFFEDLAVNAELLLDTELACLCPWPLPLLKNDFLTSSQTRLSTKALFGRYFKEIRCLSGVSQTAVAAYAHYHQRNLYNVEQLGQEPGIITAMRMVTAIAYPIGYFFAQLDQRICELEAIKSMGNETGSKDSNEEYEEGYQTSP